MSRHLFICTNNKYFRSAWEGSTPETCNTWHNRARLILQWCFLNLRYRVNCLNSRDRH